MAVVDYVNAGNQLFTHTALGASDTGQPIFMNAGWGLSCSVHAASGGGTGFNAGSVTIQVSNDNVNWSTVQDIHGTDSIFSAGGNFELSTGSQFVRPSCDASVGDVDVIFSFG